MQLTIIVSDVLLTHASQSVAEYWAQLPFAKTSYLHKVRWSWHAHPALDSLTNTFNHIFGIDLAKNGFPANRLRLVEPYALPEQVFCLVPSHLSLQRDTFSLQGVPSLTAEEYQTLTQLIEAQFGDRFNLHTSITGQYWWVEPLAPLLVTSPWPTASLYKNIYAYQPEGTDGARIRAWMNEIQMLLHEYPLNQERVQQGAWAINHAWFSSAEQTSVAQSNVNQSRGPQLIGAGYLWQGLASLVSKPTHANDVASWEKNRDSVLMVLDDVHQLDWGHLDRLIQQGKLKQLKLFLPFAGGVAVAESSRWQDLRFWQTTPTWEAIFNQLLAQIQQANYPHANRS